MNIPLMASGQQAAPSLLPFTDDFSRANGVLGNGWTGATWAIASNKAINTPTLGSDLVVNGTFATDTVWSKGTGWSISGGVATHAAGSAGSLTQSILALNKWYSVTFTVTVTAGSVNVYLGAGVIFSTATSGTYTVSGISTGGGALLQFSATSTFAGTIDNVSCRQITQGTMFAVRQTSKTDLGITSTYSTFLTGTCAGVLSNVSADLSAGLSATIDGTNIVLRKWVGTTWTILITATSTPVSNKLPEILTHRSGANLLVDLKYNGAAIGTQQTVSDAQIVDNTYAGMMGTSPANSIASFTAVPYPL